MGRPKRTRKPTAKAEAYRSTLNSPDKKKCRPKAKVSSKKGKPFSLTRHEQTGAKRHSKPDQLEHETDDEATYKALVTFSSSDWSTVSWRCMLCEETVTCAEHCIQHLMKHAGKNSAEKTLLEALASDSAKKNVSTDFESASLQDSTAHDTSLVAVKQEGETQQQVDQDAELQTIQALLDDTCNGIMDSINADPGCSLEDGVVEAENQSEEVQLETPATEDDGVEFKENSAVRKRGRPAFRRKKTDGMYTCEICLWKHRRHYNFHRHIVKHQSEAEPPVCRYCKERVTATPGATNFGLKSFNCEVCQAGPMFRRGYEKHMLEKHHGVIRENPKINRLRAPKAPEKMKSYMCDECGFVSNRQDSFEKHMKRHTDKKEVHRCPLCEFMTTEISSMKRHQRAHKEQVSCKECGTVHISLEALKTHLSEEHQCEDLDFVCATCGQVCQNAQELEDHASEHERQETVVYLCEMCSFVSLDKARLIAHQATHPVLPSGGIKQEPGQAGSQDAPSNEPELSCSQCNTVFTQWQKYEDHQQMHTEGQYNCQFCQHPQPTVLALNIHLQTTHQMASLKHQCLLCGVVEQDGEGLKRHKKQQHIVKETFVCRFCGFMAARRWNLHRHKERHEKGSLQCEHCDYAAGEKGHLYNHYIKVHHLEPPDHLVKWKENQEQTTPLTIPLVPKKVKTASKVPCEICGKRICLPALVAHRNRHRNIRPYHCHHNGCNYSAVTGSSLSKHIKRQHLGLQTKSQKPLYRCSLCNYHTIEKGRMMQHFSKKHANHQTLDFDVTEENPDMLADDIKVDLALLDAEQEIVVETQDSGHSAETLASVLHQLPLQVVTEAIEDAESPQVMHLVLPENFEGTLHLQ